MVRESILLAHLDVDVCKGKIWLIYIGSKRKLIKNEGKKTVLCQFSIFEKPSCLENQYSKFWLSYVYMFTNPSVWAVRHKVNFLSRI